MAFTYRPTKTQRTTLNRLEKKLGKSSISKVIHHLIDHYEPQEKELEKAHEKIQKLTERIEDYQTVCNTLREFREHLNKL